MKPTQTTIVVVGLCLVIVAWQISQREAGQPPEPSLREAGEAQPRHDAATPLVNPDASNVIPPPGVETAKVGSIEKQIIDTEEVLGLTVRKDRNCELSMREYSDPETAALKRVYSCTPDEASDPDPYESWNEETLAGLAYGDAHAAEVLGLRHIRSDNPRQEALGLSLLYRSVALSGELETFQKAIGQRYAYLEVDGEPQLANLRQLLVFNVIGETLGDERFNAARIVSRLQRAAVPQDSIESIQDGAKQLLRTMAALQSEMTGSRSFWEALADA